MNSGAHVVRISPDNQLLAVLVEAGRVKNLFMVNAHRKLFLKGIVDTIAERDVIRGRAQPDNLTAPAISL
jgi:hypothetical protein